MLGRKYGRRFSGPAERGVQMGTAAMGEINTDTRIALTDEQASLAAKIHRDAMVIDGTALAYTLEKPFTDRLIEAGAEKVLLGCTALEMLTRDGSVTVPFLDTTYTHARAAWEQATGVTSHVLMKTGGTDPGDSDPDDSDRGERDPVEPDSSGTGGAA